MLIYVFNIDLTNLNNFIDDSTKILFMVVSIYHLHLDRIACVHKTF